LIFKVTMYPGCSQIHTFCLRIQILRLLIVKIPLKTGLRLICLTLGNVTSFEITMIETRKQKLRIGSNWVRLKMIWENIRRNEMWSFGPRQLDNSLRNDLRKWCKWNVEKIGTDEEEDYFVSEKKYLKQKKGSSSWRHLFSGSLTSRTRTFFSLWLSHFQTHTHSLYLSLSLPTLTLLLSSPLTLTHTQIHTLSLTHTHSQIKRHMHEHSTLTCTHTHTNTNMYTHKQTNTHKFKQTWMHGTHARTHFPPCTHRFSYTHPIVCKMWRTHTLKNRDKLS